MYKLEFSFKYLFVFHAIEEMINKLTLELQEVLMLLKMFDANYYLKSDKGRCNIF